MVSTEVRGGVIKKVSAVFAQLLHVVGCMGIEVRSWKDFNSAAGMKGLCSILSSEVVENLNFSIEIIFSEIMEVIEWENKK